MTASIHPDARCSDNSIGHNSRVGPMAVVADGATIGENCHISGHTTVGNRAKIGDRVVVGSGARIGPDVTIRDDVSIGLNAVIDDSLDGASTVAVRTTIDHGVSVGAGVVVLSGVHVGLGSIVRPGSVVTTDVPPKAIVRGNPAHIVGYVESSSRIMRHIEDIGGLGTERPTAVGVGSCEIWPLPRFADLRGSLVPVEFETDLPFVPQRMFFVFDVPGVDVRGEHAHRQCSQFLVAVHGSLSVVLDDGEDSTEIRLNTPDAGLLLPPGIWGIQYKFTPDAVLGVFTSLPYDADDYIRDYGDFLRFARTRP